jgi:hypothetical protein
MSPAKTQPALLGGLAIGVLSALPVINLANCCCAWILFGGALAAYLMQQNHPEPINIGDGAIAGLLAGVVGAFVWLIISIPVNLALAPVQLAMSRRMLERASELPPELRSIFEGATTGAVVGVGTIVFFFVMLLVSTSFGMLGGIFGALMFRKSSPQLPPPIPQ